MNSDSNTGNSIAKNMAWNSVGSIAYLACQWLITVLVVRLSDSYEAAGLLALGMAVSNIFTPIGLYKMRAFQVSDTSNAYSPSVYIASRIVTVAISVIVMLVYAFLTCPSSSLLAVYLYGIYSLGPIFADVLHGIDQQKSRMDIIGKSFIARGILSLAAFCVLFYTTQSLNIALIGMTVGTFLVIGFYDLPATSRLGVSVVPQFDWKKIKRLLVVCFPAVIAAFFSSAIPAIPRQVIDYLFGSDLLGAYASVAAPVLIIQMGVVYVYTPLLGVFAEKYNGGNRQGFLQLLGKTTGAVILLSIAGMILFAFLGEWALLLLYGESILSYSYLLLPLVVCTAVTAYNWFASDLLIVTRCMKENLISYVIAFAVCMISVFPFLKLFGLNGATFAIILALGAGIVFSGICLLRVLKARQSSSGSIKEQ